MIYVEKETLINKNDLLDRLKYMSEIRIDQLEVIIDRLPTMDIVKCGECGKKYIKGMNAYCPYRVSHVMASDFCSYGERSDNANTD